jgi:hypothetical protein
LAFLSHGTRVGIRVTDPRALDRLASVLPQDSELSRTPVVPDLFSLVVGGRDPRSNLKRFNLLYLGATLLARTLDLDEALQKLEEHLHALVATQSPRKLFISATVVGMRGHAVVIPNDRPAGDDVVLKTLLDDGATYYSNQFAVLDAQGRVHAYSGRSASDTTDAAPPHPRERPPLPIGLIMLRRADRSDGPPARQLTRAQSVLRLLTYTAVSRIRPRFALAMLTRALGQAIAFETTPDGVTACLQQGGRHGPPCAARESHRSGARPRAARL